MSEKSSKNVSENKNFKNIIVLVVAIIVIIIVCIVLISNHKKNTTKQEEERVIGLNEETSSVDFNNVEVSTIKFKLKNSLSKNILKVYIRDNTNENFSNEIAGEIKSGEEIDVVYGNYSPLFIWDLKIVFEDGTDTTLNSLLAANILYDGATLDLVQVGESNVDAVNHNMATF